MSFAIIFVTSRTDQYKEMTIDFLDKNDIRYVLCVDAEVKNEKKILSDKRKKNISPAEQVVYK